ncbi:MAG: class I SAM-dependent methyltransferase [Acidimicrobiia bacterium]|nr:class I SAM-dependent methyltransferase [Acidimicrobiia bacterium]
MGGAELIPEQAGRVYDRIGRFQDWQRFYEGPATASLIAHADFEHAQSVYELGCGTGAMAVNLLDQHLAPSATYTGVDVSNKMVQHATRRLARFGNRASVQLVNGYPPLPGNAATFDRFISLYVFGLLTESLAHDLLDQARRLLTSNGRLCLVSLTHPTTRPSRALCAAWNQAWRLSPATVGGCRPIDLIDLLDGWHIEHTDTTVAWAVPSQIVTATPQAG